VAKPRRIRRLGLVLLVGAALLLGGAWVTAQDILRTSYQVPGDSKPVVLYADRIHTWVEGGQRVLLLQGRVLIEHGLLHSRAQQAVVWVDQERCRRTGITHLDVYCEGEVAVERGSETKKGPKALVDLSTRGEVKLKAQEGKVTQARQAEDPLYQRAQAARSGTAQGTSPAPVIRGVAGETTPEASPPARATLSPPVPPDNPQQGPGPVAPRQAVPGTPVQTPPPSPPPPGTPPDANPPVPPPLSATPPATTPAPSAGPPPARGPAPPPGPRGPLDGPPRSFTVAPRSGTTIAGLQTFQMPNGEQAVAVTGGVILNVRADDKSGILDIEADRLVFWTRDNAREMFGNMQRPQGTRGTRESEFYLAGNVELRQQTGAEVRTLRCDELYYDVSRNVAVAMNADLEFRRPTIPEPVHLRAEELLQLSQTQFQGMKAQVFASKLPSDPGLLVYVQDVTLEEQTVPKRTIFGRQFLSRTTGEPEEEKQSIFRGHNVFLELEHVPFFYTPYLKGDARDPLGPLETIRFGQDRIFGTQLSATWNVYDLIGVDQLPGTRWRLDTDYLSQRGPALGTEFDYGGKDLFGVPGKYQGLIKAYGIDDHGTDVLGGPRGPDQHHPEGRGRFLWRQNSQDLPQDLTLQWQINALSDKNFLEQYYKTEFDNEYNQQTFLYVKQQRDNWAWTALVEPRIRNWVTETEWLPRADGVLIGESLFNVFTYNVQASAGYAQLQPTHLPPPPFQVTDRRDDTGRFDLTQELSLPFTLGPFRIVPYGVFDLTYYTEDLTGNDRGRVYGGGGVRGSIPFSRLYPDVQSELLNLHGIYHKIVFSSNYYVAASDTPFTRLPQLDRLNDDATDQSIRDIRPLEPTYNPNNGLFLATSPLFDVQRYAIRRLVDTAVDTRDDIEVLQFDVRQRWQTKRGFPGSEHVIDWMILDLSASYFPHPTQADSGTPWAFLEYDWLWNIGDRTALTSSAWVDPVAGGARVYAVGAQLNRPDRTSFFLSYRHIDPVHSDALTGAVSYVFSPKYALTASSTYDFGTKQSLANSLTLTRMGSDLQVSIGLTYNAILNNFGFTFEVVPNLVPPGRLTPGVHALGSNTLGR
jgi:hypothetical protein